LPKDLQNICLKCLEKFPKQRYQTAGDLAADLHRFLRGEPTVARPIGIVGKSWRWCRRKPVVAGLAGALLVALVVGAASTLWQLEQVNRTAADLRDRVYASDMALAARALSENNLRRAARLLRRHLPQRGEPDLRGYEWRYLWELAEGDEEGSLPENAHRAEVSSLALMPDGRALVTASNDGTIKLWDLRSRSLIKRITTFTSPVDRLGLAVSPDGKLLLARTTDGKLTAFETVGWRAVRTLRQLRDNSNLGFLEGGRFLVAVAQNDRTSELRMWDTTSWESKTLAANTYFAACSPDGSLLAIGTMTGDGWWDQVQLLDSRGNLVGSLEPIGSDRTKTCTMRFSPDSRLLVAGWDNGQISAWDTQSRRLVKDFIPIRSLCVAWRSRPMGDFWRRRNPRSS